MHLFKQLAVKDTQSVSELIPVIDFGPYFAGEPGALDGPDAVHRLLTLDVDESDSRNRNDPPSGSLGGSLLLAHSLLHEHVLQPEVGPGRG